MDRSKLLFVALAFAALALWPLAAGNLRHRPGHQDHDLRDLRAQPRAAGRRHRPGLLRPGGVLRHRGLRRGAAVAARRRGLAVVAAAGLRAAGGAVRAGGRRAVAAHPGRVLHHGHAGLCADGLLRGARHAARRRHRRHLPQRQARARRLARPGQAARRSTASRWPAWPACSSAWRCCCARASAARWPASASTSSACAPRASRPIRTSWRRSPSRAASPGWPASCSRSRTASSTPS